MSDDRLRRIFRRIAPLLRAIDPYASYLDVVRCVSALSSAPLVQVWRACVDEEM